MVGALIGGAEGRETGAGRKTGAGRETGADRDRTDAGATVVVGCRGIA